MLAINTIADKSIVMHNLREMGLDQIANWIHILPEDKWESMFLSNWPTLAKKCGVPSLHI